MSDINFASLIKRLEVDASTGSLVCVGDDSMFGRIYLVDGKPRSARCRHLEGKEALLELDRVTLSSAKFYPGVNLIKADNFDADIDGFAIEDGEVAAADVGMVEMQAESEIDTLIDNAHSGANAGSKLSDSERAILVEELAEYVGPVADMVVSGLGSDIGVADAIKLLANEIGDADLAKQFVEKVRQKL